MSSEKVKTRILIISDTHGLRPRVKEESDKDTDDEFDVPDIRRVPTGFRHPLPEADVVLHCGDLTKRGQPIEIQETFAFLRECRAPLKLVIAGNHDLSLDQKFWDDSQLNERYGPEPPQESLQIMRDAEADNVRYLDEGVHSFDLHNGARLTIFASQWTPVYGGWAFQYPRGRHTFAIPPGVDVAMTHGPPHGVLDKAAMTESDAGCQPLFDAVRHARPKVHCFGHIHEAWGAYLARWRDEGEVGPAIDAERSRRIASLAAVEPDANDSDEVVSRKVARLKELAKQRGFHVDLTEGDTRLDEGRQTLFVNAAIMNIRYRPVQCPWIVDLDLPRAQKWPRSDGRI